jgi:hypothetical protein
MSLGIHSPIISVFYDMENYGDQFSLGDIADGLDSLIEGI